MTVSVTRCLAAPKMAASPKQQARRKSGTLETAYRGLRMKERGLRFYNPGLGRWLSRDPIGEGGGIGLYLLVANLPTSLTDAIGLQGCSSCQGPQWLDTGNREAKEVIVHTELVMHANEFKCAHRMEKEQKCKTEVTHDGYQMGKTSREADRDRPAVGDGSEEESK